MFGAIVASFAYGGGVLVDKIVLGKQKYPIKNFIPILFIGLAIITALILPKWGGYNKELFLTQKYIFLFILMIVVAVCWNIFYYRGLQKEELHEFELIMLLSPLATIVFAAIFLSSERDLSIVIPGVVSAMALVLTKIKKHHLVIGKAAKQTILGMLLMSFELIIIRELLDIYSPASLYFIRTFILAVVFLFLYRPKFVSNTKTIGLIFVSSLLGVIQMVLKFYGFKNIGVIETTMILLFGPFLVYLVSGIWLKEKILSRDVFAVSVVAACVLYVTIGR